jgi:hypothetical protein
MAFYKTCERCGASLDPGEPCDCKEAHMANHQAGETEDLITKIIKDNPRLSTNGVINKLNKLYDVKLTHAVAIKLINRMIQFDGLRADRSQSGVLVYYYKEE